MSCPRLWPTRTAALALAALCLAGSSLPLRADPKNQASAEPAAPAPSADAAATPSTAGDTPAPAASAPGDTAPPPAAAGDVQQVLPAIAADAAAGMTGDVASADADARALAPARTELEKAELRTGLAADQAQQLRAAQAQLASGRATAALILLQALNTELDADTRSYTVQPGDSLPAIAAHTEVYANSKLWPLLAHANRAALHKSGRLKSGEVLVIPAHPSVEEVTEAQEYARGHQPQARAASTK